MSYGRFLDVESDLNNQIASMLAICGEHEALIRFCEKAKAWPVPIDSVCKPHIDGCLEHGFAGDALYEMAFDFINDQSGLSEFQKDELLAIALFWARAVDALYEEREVRCA